MLEPLLTNEYTIKDAFTFAEELQSLDSKPAMAGFNLASFLCKKQLTYIEILFKDRTHVDNLSKDSFRVAD